MAAVEPKTVLSNILSDIDRLRGQGKDIDARLDWNLIERRQLEEERKRIAIEIEALERTLRSEPRPETQRNGTLRERVVRFLEEAEGEFSFQDLRKAVEVDAAKEQQLRNLLTDLKKGHKVTSPRPGRYVSTRQ